MNPQGKTNKSRKVPRRFKDEDSTGPTYWGVFWLQVIYTWTSPSIFRFETYCKTVYNRSHRSALSKLRNGTASIAHYKLLLLQTIEKNHCGNVILDEMHVLLN